VVAGTAAIRIESTDDSDGELRQLARWLRDEDELRGRVDLTHEPLRPDQMGGLVDTVTVVLTSGTAGALVTSLFTWLGHRKAAGKVSVTVESASGDRIELSCGSPEDAEKLLAVCRRTFD